MDEVFNQVTNDGVEGHDDDDGSKEHIEDVYRHVDGISSRWDVALKEHLIFSWRLQD